MNHDKNADSTNKYCEISDVEDGDAYISKMQIPKGKKANMQNAHDTLGDADEDNENGFPKRVCDLICTAVYVLNALSASVAEVQPMDNERDVSRNFRLTGH